MTRYFIYKLKIFWWNVGSTSFLKIKKGCYFFMKQKAKIVNKLGTIIIEKSCSHIDLRKSQVDMRLVKNGSTAGFNHGGHFLPLWYLPDASPFAPLYVLNFDFLNPKQVFKGGDMLDYYIENEDTIYPCFVGEEMMIKPKRWAHFKHLYKYAKNELGNRHYLRRKPHSEVDIRDYILRYTNRANLDLGFDTEWYDDAKTGERVPLSYQFSTHIDGADFDIVFYPDINKSPNGNGFGEMIHYIVDKVFAGRGFNIVHEGKKDHVNPFYESCNITLIAHFMGVDITMCKDWQNILSYMGYSKSQQKQMRSLKDQIDSKTDKKGRSLSDDDIEKLNNRLKKIKDNPVHVSNVLMSNKHCLATTSPRVYNYWYKPWEKRCMINLNLRDTMKLSPPASALSKLGEAIGIEKLDTLALDKKDNKPVNFYKENMDHLLANHPQFYHDYAVRDARISYEWYQNVKSIIGDGVTVSAISSTHLEKNIKKALDEHVRGVVSWSRDVTGFKIVDGVPDYHGLYKSRSLFGAIPDNAYMGGRNESFSHGLITGRTYDYDLRSAYPCQMQVMRMIDFEKDPIVFEEGHVLTHKDWLHIGQAGFGFVKFEFPDSVKYPTIPLKSSHPLLKGSPVFLQSGEGLVSAPDVFAAIQVGAKVTVAKQGFMLFDLKRASEMELETPLNQLDVDNDFVMHHIGFGVRNMIKIRAKYAKQYGKKSVQAQLMKILVNSTYGKTGQGIHGNTGRNIVTDETEVIPFSKITDGVIASTTTALVRCVLGIIMNYISDRGYTVHSVTTDGFISDYPWEDMLEIDDYLGSISTVFKKVIKACWGEDLDHKTGKGSILEVKHIQDSWFFNGLTRCNISLDKNKSYTNPFTNNIEQYDGVFARGGYKGDKDFYYADDYTQRVVLLDKIHNRRGRVPDFKSDMLSLRDVKEGNLKTITHIFSSFAESQKSISFDFDKKRMLLDREYSHIKDGDFKSDYGYFPSRPFKNMKEYEYNADIHKGFITLNHNIKTDADYLGYQYALEYGLPPFKVLREHKLTTNELADYKRKYDQYRIRQFLIYLLRFEGRIDNDNFFFHVGFDRKDYVDLIKTVYGIDCLNQWKDVQKRGFTGYDYLNAMKVLYDLEDYYIRVHAQPLQFEE